MGSVVIYCNDCESDIVNVWITNDGWHRTILHEGSNKYGGRLTCGDCNVLLRANSGKNKTYVK